MTTETEKTLPVDEHTVEELTKSLHELEDRIERTNATPRILFNGILTGFGGVIGATVVIAILAGIISWLATHTQEFPQINQFIQTIEKEIPSE